MQGHVRRRGLKTLRAPATGCGSAVSFAFTGPEVADDVELAESVSIAMLTVLETLTPTERAVFVLREVFDVPYDEIAATVEKTSATVRQIAHRARERVAARRPRRQVSVVEQQRVVERFLDAVRGGDLHELLDVLAPDVVVVADGGGLAPAIRKPLVGNQQAARALATIAKRAPDVELSLVLLNGAPAARIDPGGELDTAIAFMIEGNRITRIYFIRNPHKLGRLTKEMQLSRGARGTSLRAPGAERAP